MPIGDSSDRALERWDRRSEDDTCDIARGARQVALAKRYDEFFECCGSEVGAPTEVEHQASWPDPTGRRHELAITQFARTVGIGDDASGANESNFGLGISNGHTKHAIRSAP